MTLKCQLGNEWNIFYRVDLKNIWNRSNSNEILNECKTLMTSNTFNTYFTLQIQSWKYFFYSFWCHIKFWNAKTATMQFEWLRNEMKIKNINSLKKKEKYERKTKIKQWNLNTYIHHLRLTMKNIEINLH